MWSAWGGSHPAICRVVWAVICRAAICSKDQVFTLISDAASLITKFIEALIFVLFLLCRCPQFHCYVYPVLFGCTWGRLECSRLPLHSCEHLHVCTCTLHVGCGRYAVCALPVGCACWWFAVFGVPCAHACFWLKCQDTLCVHVCVCMISV